MSEGVNGSGTKPGVAGNPSASIPPRIRKRRPGFLFGCLCFLSAIPLLALLVLGCWSACLVKGLAVTVVDDHGTPLPGCFVVYDYCCSTFGFGDAGHRFMKAGIIRTDAQGRFHIPSRWCFRFPVLDQGRPFLRVHAVWSPQAHDTQGYPWALLPPGRLVLRDLSEQPGEWGFKWSQVSDLEPIFAKSLYSSGDRIPPALERQFLAAVEADHKQLAAKIAAENAKR
jgi:hypothetical protein